MAHNIRQLPEHFDRQRFLSWLSSLGEGPCSRYGDPVEGVLCRFLREATSLRGAVLFPGDSPDQDTIAAYDPSQEMVLMAYVGELPPWAQQAHLLEQELRDQAEERGEDDPDAVPASRLLAALREMEAQAPISRLALSPQEARP
jgi:hypothetical protein